MKPAIITFTILSLTVFAVLTIGGCDAASSGRVTTQDDANLVAEAIDYAIHNAAPDCCSTTWNNMRTDGSSSGYAITNGSFVHNSPKNEYWYGDGTTVSFYNFLNGSDYPHITGDVGVSGILNNNSGFFDYLGTLTLEGVYTGTVQFEIRDYYINGFNAMLIVDGKEWDVAHD